MSIVKGNSGFLDVSGDLIPTGTYTVAVWLKSASAASFENYFYYSNTASNAVRVDNWGGTLRHRLEQQFGSGAEVASSTVVDTWQIVIGSASTTNGVPRIAIDGTAVDAGGGTGTYQTPVTPALRLFGRPDGGNQPVAGGKVGMVAIYPAKIDPTDEAHLIGGGSPTALPSETALTRLWLDSVGVVVSGSDLVTWTDVIAGTVLTPSGTVTVDDADLAPIAAAGPSITPSDPVVDGAEATITTSGLSGAITATLGGHSITTAGTLPNLTYTTDIASITANGPVSAPRIGESLTLSVTGDEGEATSTVATSPAEGYEAVTLAGTLSNETDSLIDKMQTVSGLTIAVPDIMYYPTADNTDITTTGALTTDSESFTLILIQGGDADTTGSAYAFTVTPEAVTPVEPGESNNTPVKKIKGVKMKAGPISSGKVSARKLSS